MLIPLRLAACCILVSAACSLAAQTTRTVPGQFSTIQSAITASAPGDTVQVTDSRTYNESIDFQSKNITVTTGSGATINGGGGGPVVTITGATATGATLSGFTIQNGGNPQTAGGPQGGIYISGASVTLARNTLRGLFCESIAAYNSNPNITGNHITGTLATGTAATNCSSEEGLGSAIKITGRDSNNAIVAAHISSNLIEQNTASVGFKSDTGGGGAINVTNAGIVVIELNTLRYNVSTGYGGAFYLATTPTLFFLNNLVYGNKGVSGGLDIVVPGTAYGEGYIVNNTIADNTASGPNAGSDIYIGGDLSGYELVNNIVVGYTSGQTAVQCAALASAPTPPVFDHNDIFSVTGSGNKPIGGTCTTPLAQDNNIAVDPQFLAGTAANVTANTADFHLHSSPVPLSPAIDTGNNSVYNLLTGTLQPFTDLDGNPRITGFGTYPVIDMGAYEAQGAVNLTNGYITDLELSPSTYTPTRGSSLVLTATASFCNSSIVATGSITFYEDYAVIGTSAVNAPNSGSGATAFTVTNLTAGVHSFKAQYQAPNGATVTSIDLLLYVSNPNAVSTTTTLTSSLNPSNAGQLVTFTAAVAALTGTAIPTGNVNFTDGGNTIGNVPVDANGNAALPLSTLATGSHSLTAAFQPTGVFNGSTGSLTQIVNGANSVSTLTVSPATANLGDTITLTGVVTPAVASSGAATPTGTLTFSIDGTQAAVVALVNGTAPYSTTASRSGSHSYSCVYSGDAFYNSSTCNTATNTVNAAPSTLTLTSSLNPSPALTPVTFTATLTTGTTPVPNAPVVFTVDGASPQTATTNPAGIAQVSASITAGSHLIAANVAATATYTAAMQQLTQVATPNPTSITLLGTPNPAYQGQNVTFVASILALAGTSSPNGTVTLYDGSNPIATQPTPASVQGAALTSVTFNINTLAPGAHTLNASYTPDINFLASATTSPFAITILQQTFTLTASTPSITIETQHHGTLTLTASAVGNFNGTVYFSCNAPLPPVLTCTLAQPSLVLNGSGAVSTAVALETDAIPGFYAATKSGRSEIFAALGLPLALLTLARRRKLRSRLLLLAAFCAITATSCLTGCSGKYPDHTPPGTYALTFTATGTAQGSTAPVTQTVPVTLVVTP